MKRSYLILLLLGVFTTIALSLLSFFSFTELSQIMRMRQQIVQQRENLLLLLSDFKDAETGQRGYVITGFQDYLEPYYQSLKAIDEHYRLIEAGLNTSRDESLFQELSRLMKLKLDDLNDHIQVRTNQGFEAARLKVASREGKRFMDHMRRIIDDMVTDRDQRLKQHEEQIKKLSDRSFWLNVLAGILNAFLVGLFSFLFYRDSKKLNTIKHQFDETHELYKAILDSTKQIIMTTNAQGIVTTFNKGAEKALGYQAEEVMGKISILNFYSQGKMQGAAQEIVSKTAHFQHSEFETLVAPSRYLVWTDAEWMMKRKNGILFPCLQSITALRDASEGIKGYLFMGSDLTERKKWEQDLQDARKAIEEAQLSKSQMLENFSVAAKTPLNSIMNLSLLWMKNLGGNLKEQGATYATRISDNCQSILNLLNEMLAASRQEGVLSSSGIATQTALSDQQIKLTVLVIEDDLDFQSILKAYLQDLGCQAITAASGEEGLRLAKAYPIDLIIMDMLMAPMNGYDIVRKLQDDPELKRIPFAFISVIAKEIQGKIPGALAFLNKPIRKEDVALLLQKYQKQYRF